MDSVSAPGLSPVSGSVKGSLPASDRTEFSVNFKLTESLSEQLRVLFPAYRFTESSCSSTESLHPLLHCERLVKENEAIKMTTGYVVDIGGNPQRHYKYGRHVWSMCPTLSAADGHRKDKFRQSGVFSYCEHLAPAFVDDCACSQANTFLSIDSLYYLTVNEINTVVNKAALIAVVHDFSETQGSFYNESKYTVGPDGQLSMTVNGSSIAYKHSALGWMRSASCFWDHERNIGFSWYLVKTVGTSLIYKFLPLDGPTPSDPVALHVALTDGNKYGSPVAMPPEQFYGVLGNTTLLALPWGGSVVVRFGVTHVVVPKQIVAHARMASVYTPRTPDQFQVVVRKVKDRVIKDDTILESEKPDVVLIASALGFIADMQMETLCLDNVQSAVNHFGKHHNAALNFKLGGVGRRMIVGAVAATTVGVFAKPQLFSRIVGSALTIIMSNKTMVIGLLAVAALPAAAYVNAGSVAQTLGAVQARDHGSLVKGGEIGSVVLPGYESEPAYMLPKKGAWFTFSYAWRKIRERGAQLCGAGLACCIPVVSSDTPANEERAIIHRALNTKGEPVEGEWAKVGLILDDLITTKIIKPVKFDTWNSRFPIARQRAQKKALDVFNSCPDIEKVRASCVRKAFIKREKLLKSSELGIEDFDPRVIQGAGDLANCLLGPWMYSFGKYLAHEWSIENSVTYASGLNGESLGEWMTLSENLGFTHFLENDFSRYDASLCREALTQEQSVYNRLGAGKWAKLVLQQQLQVRGRSSHGHQYYVEGTRCSGDPNTSPGNSMLTAGATVYVMNELGIKEFRIIVMGDDSVVACRQVVNLIAVETSYSKLGLVAKSKLHDDADLVEFCSGRFWRTSGGRVWGPKVGRTLAKVGFSVSPQPNPRAWMKGVLLGMSQDCAHVPLLNVYVDHCLKLLSKEKASATKDEYKFHVSQKHKPTPDTYQQFYKVYNLQPDQLDTLKAAILDIKSLPILMDNPLFRILVEVDV